jgi:hypothetical protein
MREDRDEAVRLLDELAADTTHDPATCRVAWCGAPQCNPPAVPDTTGGELRAEDVIRAARAMDAAGVPADASPEAIAAVALTLRDLLAERDKLAAQVRRVREVADSYGRWPFRVDPLNVTRRIDRALGT